MLRSPPPEHVVDAIDRPAVGLTQLGRPGRALGDIARDVTDNVGPDNSVKSHGMPASLLSMYYCLLLRGSLGLPMDSHITEIMLQEKADE